MTRKLQLRAVDGTDNEAGPVDGKHPNRHPGWWRTLTKLAGELRDRRVCRTAITYALALWLGLQIGDVLFPMFEFPPWALELVMLIGLLCFPVVLIASWVFQITPDGIIVDIRRNPRDPVDHTDSIINVLLVTMSVVLAVLMLARFAHGEDADWVPSMDASAPAAGDSRAIGSTCRESSSG